MRADAARFKRPQPTHEAIVHQAADGTIAIRNGNWKAVVAPEPMGTQLFDLDNALGERHDVATASSASSRPFLVGSS